MPRLSANSTPAERMRGCVFAETFETQDKVVANGGTVNGTPTFDGKGVFNGIDQYVQYAEHLGRADAGKISICFKARFNSFSSRDGIVTKRGVGNPYWQVTTLNSNKVEFYLYDGTAVLAQTPVLEVGTWYSFVCVCDTSVADNMKIYTNGVAGTSADPTGRTLTGNPNPLRIGYELANDDYCDGDIKDVQIYNELLTEQEALDYHNGTTYDYINQAIVDLPMGFAQHDPVNNRTLDVSGNGLHATLGAGDGGATTPTKLTERGYNVASGDYFAIADNANLRPDNLTSVALIKNWQGGADRIAGCGDGSTYGTNNWYYTINANGSVGVFLRSPSSPITSPAGVVNPYTASTVGITHNLSDTTTKIYVDGVLVHTDTTHSIGTDNETGQIIGGIYASGSPSANLDADVKQYFQTNEELTPLQMADLHLRMMKQINDN